jgi:hypothetical protein
LEACCLTFPRHRWCDSPARCDASSTRQHGCMFHAALSIHVAAQIGRGTLSVRVLRLQSACVLNRCDGTRDEPKGAMRQSHS